MVLCKQRANKFSILQRLFSVCMTRNLLYLIVGNLCYKALQKLRACFDGDFFFNWLNTVGWAKLPSPSIGLNYRFAQGLEQSYISFMPWSNKWTRIQM